MPREGEHEKPQEHEQQGPRPDILDPWPDIHDPWDQPSNRDEHNAERDHNDPWDQPSDRDEHNAERDHNDPPGPVREREQFLGDSSDSSNSSASRSRGFTLDAETVLEFALHSGPTALETFEVLLKDYQAGLGERYSKAKRAVPRPSERLADVAKEAIGPNSTEAQQRVVGRIAAFEKARALGGTLARQNYPKHVTGLESVGRSAIKEILEHVKKVATAPTATRNDPPDYLVGLIGVAERIGKTVLEALSSPCAWSLAMLDAAATRDPWVASVATESLLKWDLAGGYKQAKEAVLGTARELGKNNPKCQDFADRAAGIFDPNNPPRSLDEFKGKTREAADTAIGLVARDLADTAASLKLEAKKTGVRELDQIAEKAQRALGVIAAAMAAQLRNRTGPDWA